MSNDISEERRKSLRVEVLGRIHGEMVLLDVPITLLDLSQGGFSMQTTSDFPIGAMHTFRFTSSNRVAIVLHARIVHTLRTSSGGGAVSCVIGLEFIDRGHHDVEQGIATLVSILQPVLSSS